MAEGQLDADRRAAQHTARLVNAWSAAQTVVEQLQPALRELGLLKDNGALDTDRVLLVMKKARGEGDDE